MKNTMKLFLAIVIFCSVGFADGDQPNGGYQCPMGGCVPPTCQVECTGNMMSGPDGDENGSSASATDTYIVLTIVREALKLRF